MYNVDGRAACVVPSSDGFTVLIIKSDLLEQYQRLNNLVIAIATAISKIIPHKINDETITVELSINRMIPDTIADLEIIMKSVFKINDKAVIQSQQSYVITPIIPDKFILQSYLDELYQNVLITLINAVKTGQVDTDAYKHLIRLKEDNNG